MQSVRKKRGKGKTFRTNVLIKLYFEPAFCAAGKDATFARKKIHKKAFDLRYKSEDARTLREMKITE